MRHFVEGTDRAQSTLFPECLEEDWIGEDNPVRVIDIFVDELGLAELGFRGRPSFQRSQLETTERFFAELNNFASAVLLRWRWPMDQVNDPRELKRQLDQAMRLVSVTSDQRTYQRIGEFIEELRQRLQRCLAARRSQEEISARARELWEQHGRPPGRDLEFWLRAERELGESGDE